MDITPLIPQGRQIIDGYGVGGFKISGVQYQGSVLLFPSRTVAWPVTNPATLEISHFAALLEPSERPEILLLGSGKNMQPVHPDIRQFLRKCKIALDVMDTGAACRTYNVLASEDRHVAAALIAV